MNPNFVKRTLMAAPAAELFAWHERPGAFLRLSPPWTDLEVIDSTGGIRDGDLVNLAMRMGPITLPWRIRHGNYIAGRQFEDLQVRGPFTHWVHRHLVEPAGERNAWLEDAIEYELPLGIAGRVVAGRPVRAELERLFEYRHAITSDDLRDHMLYADRPRLRVLIVGEGLLASGLSPFLTTGGHTVVSVSAADLVAGRVQDHAVFDAAVYPIEEDILHRDATHAAQRNGPDAIRSVSAALARLPVPPRRAVIAVPLGMIATSADRAVVADAVSIARQAGISAVIAGTAPLLTPKAGLLKGLAAASWFGKDRGLGAHIPWISFDDAIGLLHHLVMNGDEGTVKIAAPSTVSMYDLMEATAAAAGRPVRFPSSLAKVGGLFGVPPADELRGIVAETSDAPDVPGYRFRHPKPAGALAFMWGRGKRGK